jgi:type IV secretion system protein TrbG
MVQKLPFFLLVLTSFSAWGQTPSPSPSPSKFDPSLLGGNRPELTEQEREGVSITQSWKDKSAETLVSRPGVNPSAQFRFGESYPSIVCAILQVTDIELQPGEVVTQINLGDTTRWSVESAKSGSGETQVEHLIVKPRDIGLSTSLVVTTDKRTYHLLLVSSDREWMYFVNFTYPADSPAASSPASAPSPAPSVKNPPRKTRQSEGKQVVSVSRQEVVAPKADDADDSYAINGQAEWRPVQVYSKDGKTFVEMPAEMRHKEAPVLFEEKKGGWFHHDKVLVNYRVHGRWYVVDRVLDKATLVSGVGSGQTRVEIRHVEGAKKEGTE